ncbi:DoxX family protein [Actinobacteria bacterium YIM 96077]|uniref:DoxX family protein n=1 Tax=Phytoactinopolyspora halophila TaxID=1981511 RepID=A0A329R7C9_9ACTN|nr:DoxX family protein [Phytoactinopolyspora halophila]AYY15203.1 DoxX family protein [Actinobacteria bacterium YIM 96077]RAW18998.1 hypothetical protein DPM12_02370 [Phytoactinopolyspora halophila]
MAPTRVLHDAGRLLLRAALAVVFVAHGWQKVYDWTIEGTTERFVDMEIPFPEVSAPTVAVLELVGGGLLGLGVLTRLVAVALGSSMIGALVLVHAENGPFVEDGGWELVLVLAAGCMTIALVGPGRVRMDRVLVRWFEKEDDELAEPPPRGRK